MNVMFAAKTTFAGQRVIGSDDARWVRLRDLIKKLSLMEGTFKLSSGATSTFLFQLRQTTMCPEGQFLIGTIVHEFMRRIGVSCIGGLELGAVPVVSAVSFASFVANDPVHAFFVRKKAKEHGAKELIDGDLPVNADVLMVDDVTTSGRSIVTAIENAKSEKACNVRWALSIVDRDQGATDLLGQEGISLASIFTKADFGL